MEIAGYFRSGFNPLPAPHVQAFVYFPRLNVSGPVDFLIDTGADNTCLHTGDIAKLGISYRRLSKRSATPANGIGGSLMYSKEAGFLIFRDNQGSLLQCELNIHICHKAPTVEGLPSLLGRDFLNLCVMTVDKSRDRIRLEPLNVFSNTILPLGIDPSKHLLRFAPAI